MPRGDQAGGAGSENADSPAIASGMPPGRARARARARCQECSPTALRGSARPELQPKSRATLLYLFTLPLSAC